MSRLLHILILATLGVTALAEDHAGGGERGTRAEWEVSKCQRLQPDGKIVGDQPKVTANLVKSTNALGSGTFQFGIQFGDGTYSADGSFRHNDFTKVGAKNLWQISAEQSYPGGYKVNKPNLIYEEGPGNLKTITMMSKAIQRDPSNLSRRVRLLRINSRGQLVEVEMTFINNMARDLRVLRTCGNAFGFQLLGHHEQPRSYSLTPPAVPAGLRPVSYSPAGTVAIRRNAERREAWLMSHLLDLEIAAR